MQIDSRAEAWVRLHSAALPARTLVELLRRFGSAEAVVAAHAPGSRSPAREVVRALNDPGLRPRIDASLAWLAQPGHGILAWDDPAYPALLLQSGDAPALLFAMGELRCLERPGFAIVGSRNATAQGCADAQAFAAALAGAGLCIVSGLAVGIDAAAHRGALDERGGTIAVIGTGPDRVYPAENRELAHAIAERGLILSEFAPGTPPLPGNFPRRNRLISGLARGLLVVEATLSSGSLITARLAGEQGREVFALPGSIHSPFTKGCHKLIREGAKLVESARDILEELHLVPETTGAPVAHRDAPPSAPGSAAALVLEALGFETCDVDALVAATGLAPASITATLSELAVEGRVAALAGGRWQRIHLAAG